MKCNEIEINLPEFIDSKLDKSVATKVEEHIQSCESCRKTYDEFHSFLKFSDSFPEIEPPADMKDEFLLMLENEETKPPVRRLIPDWIKVAAAILIAFGTFAAGYFSGNGKGENKMLMAEMESLKQQVLLAGLQDYSGPQKIEAVYNVAEVDNANTDLIEALVYTLNSDKNVNVRLAALSVLSDMISTNEGVKSELINSLLIQDNPLMQISLIQALTQAGVKEAKENIELISGKDETDPNVKDFAENMVKTII